MKRFVLSLLAAVLTIPVVRAEVRPRGPFEDGRLPLVPYPAEVCLGERDFDLGERLTVRICSGDEEDFFAASTLTDELIGVRTDVKESRSGIERSVTLTRPGLCRAADERLAQAGLAPDSDPEGYVLLADEPSGNLDTKNREEIHRLFFTLRDTLGQTVVIVTHDGQLAAMSDRKIEMVDGQIVR